LSELYGNFNNFGDLRLLLDAVEASNLRCADGCEVVSCCFDKFGRQTTDNSDVSGDITNTP
jgi:hypothetical protein